MRVLRDLKARGFHPYYVAFVNQRGHARSIGHADIAREIEFLHWLALDLAEPFGASDSV
jgi:hypothetical protein